MADENDLVTRLRGRAAYTRDQGGIKSAELMEQAADEIERLQTELNRRPLPYI